MSLIIWNLITCKVSMLLFFSDKITPQQCIDTWNLLYHITIRQSSTDSVAYIKTRMYDNTWFVSPLYITCFTFNVFKQSFINTMHYLYSSSDFDASNSPKLHFFEITHTMQCYLKVPNDTLYQTAETTRTRYAEWSYNGSPPGGRYKKLST